MLTVAAPSSVAVAALRPLLRHPGKRLRPALHLLVACEGGAADEAREVEIAACIELLHVASLIHDDIVDGAPTRRHERSAHVTLGVQRAADAGSALASAALATLVERDARAARLAAEAVAGLSLGELAETAGRYDAAAGVAQHLEIVRRKTAALFELPLRTGALSAGLPGVEAEALARCGRAIGMAFQLVDDALDWMGDPARLGKSAGADVRNGIYALPLLLAAGSGGTTGREVRAILARDAGRRGDVERLGVLLAQQGWIARALCVADELVQQGLAALEGVELGAVPAALRTLGHRALDRQA